MPRIESVVPVDNQPQADAKATIWYDDFDTVKKYREESGQREGPGYGGAGEAMRCLYEKGKRGDAGRKVFFGDAPFMCMARAGEKFDEVYWRVYVKHQPGWICGEYEGTDYGGPDKLSRATMFVDPNVWKQGIFAHVWGGPKGLTLDPASGIKNGQVVTTKYNDFDNMRWLGNSPGAKFNIHAPEETGWWVCVECRAKLNTPGKKDGLNQLWIDGRLECERSGLDWRNDYDEFGINAVFLEAYWNKGSPVTQKRWYDNFVISTEPIGPMVCPRKPELIKTPLEDCEDWEIEIASDADGKQIVWRSKGLGKDERVKVTSANGNGMFEGAAAKKKELPGGGTYWCRARQKAKNKDWSEWSHWHQAFRTEE
ncbi:MAG: hypothetical protein H6839_11620 [Planctomycetes bacterium]|nr:hypothetical protein [Planctomycetota bacterium]